jgi:hypothetical protein
VATGSGQSEETEAGRARRGCWATGKRRRKGREGSWAGFGMELSFYEFRNLRGNEKGISREVWKKFDWI